MSVAERIAILHISDLHFGQVLANNEFHFIQGWSAHDLTLCKAMPLALEDAFDLLQLNEEDKPHIVVSGDLTCTGTAKEFAVAHTFLKARWHLNRSHRSVTGLDARDKHIVSVPGNHDHWNGKRLPPTAYTEGILDRHFERTPWVRRWISPRGKLELEVYGMDSNSTFGTGQTNLQAKGGFSPAELMRFERRLRDSDTTTPQTTSRRVRILVTHHSLSYVGGGLLGIKELDPSSRNKVLELAGKYDLVAVLTGHTHNVYWKPFNLHRDGSPWEFRSATTFQGPPKAGAQGFWIHLLRLEGIKVTWTSISYHWDGASRFVRSTEPDIEFVVHA